MELKAAQKYLSVISEDVWVFVLLNELKDEIHWSWNDTVTFLCCLMKSITVGRGGIRWYWGIQALSSRQPFQSLHGKGLTSSSLPIGENTYLLPIKDSTDHVRYLVENLFLGLLTIEHPVELETFRIDICLTQGLLQHRLLFRKVLVIQHHLAFTSDFNSYVQITGIFGFCWAISHHC